MSIAINRKSINDEFANSRKEYVTTWNQGNKKGTYKTKALTEYHRYLHNIKTMDSVMTTCIHLDIDWAFGKYTEVIAITNTQRPQINKPFPIELITLKMKSNKL